MKHIPLDVHDDMPIGMKRYINNFGWHFNKKAYDYATKLMFKRNPKTNKDENIKPYTKDEVEELLNQYNIELKTKIMYDYVFAATMCKADYLDSSIEDEEHLIKYVKDTIDDVDASDETTFRRWVATMIGNGLPIDWYEIC
mgnify:CR=1 FL=1|nr:MAG TPA: hypothetical protein [Crassvirales sp.]DAR29013.1 MAG TPA: hypothetical protein [Crassvirales sp.]